MSEPQVVVITGANRGIANLNLENSGSFWHSNGEELPW